MERRGLDGPVVPSNSVDGGTGRTSTHRLQQPDYSEKSVQEALEHLASIDLIELPTEAKVEHCRATRDLRSCGRSVERVLNSCGHASLCAECSRRCDICPICRIPIPKKGNIFRLRLYNECVAARLISKGDDDRFQEKQNGENQLIADVQRLYSLFDVAIDNNLVSLICHYVTDVCMDESAVSSDPLIAFLLDEVVVKDWCKRTFKNIITELQGIYKLALQEMKTMLGSLLKSSVKLVGLSNVLEVLESSFRDTLSVQLHDLHDLQDSILKTKQHIEMMIWCLRHQFLENVGSRHTNITSWRSHVRERKSAAIKRSWPDSVNHSADSMRRRDGSTLFIEDALSNLEIEQGYSHETAGELEIASLQKDGGSSFFRSTIEGMAGCYPFENLRAATDMLFWHGSSDLVVAKQAIFLYYLFDRHWTIPDEEWRYVVDDFAATFSISRHSLLESFTFYLLDDHTNEALQEACRLLPEISGPTTHPKVAQVLLERQNPDAALMVLRWSGRDGGSQLVSLGEAITTVRVRVECGLLTEAFMYQRMLCTKVKERKLMHGSRDASDDLKDECRTWVDWVEALVTEICCLCIRRNLVDRMIELPWNLDEEKYLHKSLLDFAIDDPSTTIGSLLVVFYLQRYRYIEAYQIDRKLQNVEQDFISKNSVSEEVLLRMESASHWRTGLVAKSIELLPEVQQQQVKTGKLPELVCPALEVDIPANSDIPEVQEPNSTSLLVPSSIDSSLPNQMDKATTFLKPLGLETPSKLGVFSNNSHFGLGKYGSPSIPHGSLFMSVERGLKPQSGIGENFKFEGMTTPGTHPASPMTATPRKEFNRNSSRVPWNSSFLDHQFDKVSAEKEQNGFTNRFQNTRPHSTVLADPVTPLSGNHFLSKDSAQQTPYLDASSKQVPSDRSGRPRKVVPEDDQMDISWSHGEKDSVEYTTANGGLRWRSDDTSEDEEQQTPDRLNGAASQATHARKFRRSRFARR